MSATCLICTIVVIAATVYDLLVITIRRDIKYSISRWFASYSYYPVIVFGVGYLCGHFFGLMTPTPPAGGPLPQLSSPNQSQQPSPPEENK